ncbi:hypothetical protein CD790_29705 [Streptomyces sp. SAJ15]|nr:hypothetical protein CD790_29705 [Streptomyces sp. SAJ15]
MVRWVVGAATTAVATASAVGLSAGAAHADEYPKDSHNGARFAVVNTGQIDDPMEDVLEHFLLWGDGYTWD